MESSQLALDADIGSAAGSLQSLSLGGGPVAGASPSKSPSDGAGVVIINVGGGGGGGGGSGPSSHTTASHLPLAWQQPHVSYAPSCFPEAVPGPRAAHSANIIGNNLYVFGGWNGKAGLTALSVLNTESMEWSCPPQPPGSGSPPSARNNHATFVYGTKLYVHGGHDGVKWLGDLHVYDSEKGTWAQVEVSGAVPSPRACHTITLVGRRAILFGGFDGSSCYNDLLMLDLDTMTWIQPKNVAGTPPQARNAQTVIASGPKLYLFGGHSGNKHLRDLHVLDTEKLEWSQPEMKGALPPGLRGHTANLIGTKMFLFGGYDGRGRSNELYIYDVATSKWEHPPTHETTPTGRQRHTSCLVRGRLLLVLGGFDGFKWLNDLHVLDVGKWNDSAIALSSVYGLLHDLAWLVNNPDSFPDVEFSVAEHAPEEGSNGTRPPRARVVGHKAILAARSPHFRAMFSSGMREAREPRIQLHDEVWTKGSLLALLEFLYTGGVRSLPPDVAMEAMAVAQYTAVDGLKALCESSLISVVDAANVTGLLLAAQKNGAAELKRYCMEFCFKHHGQIDLSALQPEPLLLVEIANESMRRARSFGGT